MGGVAGPRLLTGVAVVAVALAGAVPQPAASVPVASADRAVRYAGVRAYDQLPGSVLFGLLQVNLCNSGVAGCYAGGQSIPETAALVRAQHPDVLTLNEVCRGDGERGLVQAMRQSWPGDRTFQAFAPAWDQRRQAPYLCRNGEQYGVGIIGHIARGGPAGVDLRGGRYPVQDASSDEGRAWLCVRVVGSYDACTTHLAADAAEIAMAQCRYLMGTAIPRAWAAMGGYSPTVVGGDLNVRHGGQPDVRDCVPAGWLRTGDGDV